MRPVALVLLAALVVVGCGDGDEPFLTPPPVELDENGVPIVESANGADAATSPSTAAVDDDPRLGFEGRADINRTGNRVSTGVGDLDGPAIEVELDSAAIWVVPSSPEAGTPWVVVLADGQLVWVDPAAGSVDVIDDDWGDAEPVVRGVDRIAPWDVAASFAAALPDGRIVGDDDVSVVLADPTDRYGHAVLGDDIEAAAIEIYAAEDGALDHRVVLERDVVEGRSALLGDADGDGTNEILVTQSNDGSGARLVLYDLQGGVVAESPAIGRGNRWRNQLAIAPLGPDGEIEIIDVRTPHLGRTLEWFRLEGDELVRVATRDGYTSHVLGSRNLELAIVADADGDGRLEVVAPVSDREALHVIERTADGTRIDARIDLGARLSSNIGAVDHPDGGATYAAGTTDGRLRFWVS